MNKRSWCFVVALMVTPAAGVAQDFEAGLSAYKTSDHATAVQQNHAEAMRWYRLAAEQGNARAETALGAMYYDGQGVLRDYVSAHMWFNLAAATGSTNDAEIRDNLESLMTPADISEAQRRARVCFNSNYRDCD